MSETPAKIYINLKEGIIEIEGSEEFVEKILNDHKYLFSDKTTTVTKSTSEKPKTIKRAVKTVKESKARKKTVLESLTAIDLDLSGTDKYPTLKDFYLEKKPKSYMEKTCVFIYYIEENLGLTPVTPGHLLTCYRAVGSRIPAKLGQSILDSKYKGWVTAESGINGGSLSHIGTNLVELDLPRKKND